MNAKQAAAKAKTKAKSKPKPKTKPSSPEKRLKELGIVLPTVPTPVANYVPYVRTGKLVFLSGQGPRRADGDLYTGKVGTEVTVEDAYEHARLVGLGLLAALRAAAGSLDKVKRAVKLLGMVNGAPGFGDHPKVINGCSDLLVEILGDRGRHARSAVGMGGLPGNMTVEIEAIFELV
jgi:enamine deaminase RidA (YjgF/YER057c/UK114 family)